MDKNEKPGIFPQKDSIRAIDIKRRVDEGSFCIQPDFQRSDVWTTALKSKLIESALLGMPIPQIFTVETRVNGSIREDVVDGQQRLMTFMQYIAGDFKLSRLQWMTKCSGKRFAELDSEDQATIKEYSFSVVKITKDSTPDLKYDLFERLNRGSVALNKQEIRDCIFHGGLINLVKELTVYEPFDIIARTQLTENQLKRRFNEELVLRFLAMYHDQFKKYRRPVSTFLDKFADEFQDNTAYFDGWKQIFKQTITLIRDIYGNLPFINPAIPQKENMPFNIAMYDCMMHVYSTIDPRVATKYLSKLKDVPQVLAKESSEFASTVSTTPDATSQGLLSTSTPEKVKRRIELFTEAVNKVIG